MNAVDTTELYAVEGGQMSECEVKIRTVVSDLFGPGAVELADTLVWLYC